MLRSCLKHVKKQLKNSEEVAQKKRKSCSKEAKNLLKRSEEAALK